MRERRWLLLFLYGTLIAFAVSDALKATRPKFKIASSTTTTTTEETSASESTDDEAETTTISTDQNVTMGHVLTGIPQIDYIWDPNLPRELNGYNLSDYPFYSSMPEDIDFKCDGLHDGFYASVPHKCQVYHHCLFGTRYDFLCANFTAFDQKTFICHFVSEVDCANSKKYWHRNDALYKATTTSTSTTSSTTTTTTTSSSVEKADKFLPPRDRDSPGRRRRPPVRRPAYDYYYEDYYDDDFQRARPRGFNRRDYEEYDDRKYRRDPEYRHRDYRDRDRLPPARTNRRDPTRARDSLDEEPIRPRVRDQDSLRTRDIEDRPRDEEDRRFRDDVNYDKDSGTSVSSNNDDGSVKSAAPLSSVYARPRNPPKFRRPVPLSEQDKYAHSVSSTIRSQFDESRRRPVSDEVDEPRKQPTIDDSEEPRRRVVPADLSEFRKRPAVDTVDEVRRRPLPDTVDEPRRKPAEVIDDYYYEDEIEEVRPRWTVRGRPLREFSDTRYRDRPFRPRYRDDEDDTRFRKQLERPRDWYYERERERISDRNRNRSLDRSKERNGDRERSSTISHDIDKSERTSVYNRSSDRDKGYERLRNSSRLQDPEVTTELPRKSNTYGQNTEKEVITTDSKESQKETTNSQTEYTDPFKKQRLESAQIKPESQPQQQYSQVDKIQETTTDTKEPSNYRKSIPSSENSNYEKDSTIDDYASEYYDDIEEPIITTLPPPRSTVRIIKRPFLPSRGGNPNPRGLLPVGSRAQSFYEKDENPLKQNQPKNMTIFYTQEEKDSREVSEIHRNKSRVSDNKQTHNIYKNVQQTDSVKKQEVNNNYDAPNTKISSRQPESVLPKRQPEIENVAVSQKKTSGWITDTNISEQNNEANNQGFDQQLKNNIQRQQDNNSNIFSSSYKNDDAQEKLALNRNFKARQKINEVTHRNLQDIPESEYDVTLNEALTPNLSQEPNLPSGFVLPLHRQFDSPEKDTVLQPSDSNYKYSNPTVQQSHHHQSQPKKKQTLIIPQIQQTTFLPSGILRTADRGKTVYIRTPETIQITENQYRQQRGHWMDYTGF